MQRIIGVTELQRRFRAVFDDVAKKQVPYMLTRGSRPEAVLISYEEFLRFQALQEQEVLANFNRLSARLAAQSANVTDDEAAADVAAAIAELNE
jgi:prevent-host-death family protein